MTIADTTISITALLDELTEQLSYLPGKHPQDSQIASTLLALTMTHLYGTQGGHLLLNTLERRGCDRQEAEQVARALGGLALRLGAWLGRDDKGCQKSSAAPNGAKVYHEVWRGSMA